MNESSKMKTGKLST